MPLEELDEFITPKTIFTILLAFYRMALAVYLEYRNLERARNTKHTTWFLLSLPVAIVLIYWLGIGDLFFGWLLANYALLQPVWPAVKSSIVVPKPLISAFNTTKKVFVPRFLRQSSGMAPDEALEERPEFRAAEKLKNE